MSQSAKLRQLHLTLLVAVNMAKEIQCPEDFSIPASLELLRQKEEIEFELESVIFDQLYTIKRIVDIVYPAISPDEIKKLETDIRDLLSV